METTHFLYFQDKDFEAKAYVTQHKGTKYDFDLYITKLLCYKVGYYSAPSQGLVQDTINIALQIYPYIFSYRVIIYKQIVMLFKQT